MWGIKLCVRITNNRYTILYRSLFSDSCSKTLFQKSNEDIQISDNGHYENKNTCSSDLPYYIENGLRKVYPYYYRHSTFCKGRWINRKLLDVYSQEFALYPKEEYINRISKGLLLVNGKQVDLDYVLKNADYLTATVHRHELPVLAASIGILFENDDLLVVNKPPSVPVHPCGLYRHNSLLFILANENKIRDLCVVHRLDRLTSGVLILAKTSEKSRELHDEMNLRNIRKEYVCRVEGNFPDERVVCNKPIKHLYYKVGVGMVDSKGKISITEFQKLNYNGKSSVVLCKPLTGRTHQIRVHLQFLGYPIVNDPLYNSFIFGPNKGKGGIFHKTIDQLLEDLVKEHSSQWCLENPMVDHNYDTVNGNIKVSMLNLNYKFEWKFKNTEYQKDNSKLILDQNCYFCKTLHHDPQQTHLGIFLHALKYQGNDWEFKSEMPFWASEDWNII